MENKIINVQLDAETHRQARIAAAYEGVSMKAWATEVLTKAAQAEQSRREKSE